MIQMTSITPTWCEFGPAPLARARRAMPSLSIRVEYVNKREAMHFSELSGALEFIAESVRRNVLQAET